MFDRVFALGRVRIPAPASDMSCPTGPRNRCWFFVDQIVDPGIIEITLLRKENQTMPLKIHT